MKLLANEWSRYVEHVVPTHAEATQVTETRRAFYAGAFAMFHTIIEKLSPEPDATEIDLRIMDGLATELKEWEAEMKREGA